MASRYDNSTPARNADELYSELFKKRGLPFIIQWKSPTIKYPTDKDLVDLTVVQRVWTQGDRFFKYASEYYGDSTYWWIIPWFNQKPLESDFKLGDIVDIPTPLSDILDYFY